MPLDGVYNADEAAKRMRITKRVLIKLGRKHGACSRVGREYLFSESDLLAIWQAIREPAVSPPVIGHAGRAAQFLVEDLSWLANRPPVKLDRREIGVLRFLAVQTRPLTHKDIERAGENTIRELLQMGMLKDCGSDRDGLSLVKITPEGRDQIKIVDRWIQKRAASGRRPTNW